MPGKPVVTPINPYTLSFDDKRKVSEAVNMIKQKICRKIKERNYTDVSKQKIYLKEGESISLPTVYLE